MSKDEKLRLQQLELAKEEQQKSLFLIKRLKDGKTFNNANGKPNDNGKAPSAAKDS